jgi:hypothetical protein
METTLSCEKFTFFFQLIRKVLFRYTLLIIRFLSFHWHFDAVNKQSGVVVKAKVHENEKWLHF